MQNKSEMFFSFHSKYIFPCHFIPAVLLERIKVKADYFYRFTQRVKYQVISNSAHLLPKEIVLVCLEWRK